MVKINKPKRTVATAIFARHEKEAEDWRRRHLGASIIGEECMRALWYTFRWASPPDFGGRMLRLFERGHREEEWIVEELRKAGFKVHNVEASNDQYRFEAFGGHFGGSIDGVILGVPEAKKTWHLLEVKSINAKGFAVLQRDGVRKAQPKHFDQMQTYMREMELTRALYISVCKNDDHIYVERINYDPKAAQAIMNKAETVIGAKEPLGRISEDPSWFKCKFCSSRPHCHLEQPELLERNCRTCLSSTPLEDGKWACDLHKKTLDDEDQREGCVQHLFIPAILPDKWEATGVGEDSRYVDYSLPNGSTIRDSGKTLRVVKP